MTHHPSQLQSAILRFGSSYLNDVLYYKQPVINPGRPFNKVVHEEGQKKIVSITRWGIFTKTIIENPDKDFDISEIGGNDEILVSVLEDNNGKNDPAMGEMLYESRVVTKPNKSRKVYLLPVHKLLSFVKEEMKNGVEIEHIYDY